MFGRNSRGILDIQYLDYRLYTAPSEEAQWLARLAQLFLKRHPDAYDIPSTLFQSVYIGRPLWHVLDQINNLVLVMKITVGSLMMKPAFTWS